MTRSEARHAAAILLAYANREPLQKFVVDSYVDVPLMSMFRSHPTYKEYRIRERKWRSGKPHLNGDYWICTINLTSNVRSVYRCTYFRGKWETRATKSAVIGYMTYDPVHKPRPIRLNML